MNDPTPPPAIPTPSGMKLTLPHWFFVALALVATVLIVLPTALPSLAAYAPLFSIVVAVLIPVITGGLGSLPSWFPKVVPTGIATLMLGAFAFVMAACLWVACTPAQVATAESVDQGITTMACSPLDPLDSIAAVRFVCVAAEGVESLVQSLTVAVPPSQAKAFAAKHPPRVRDAGLSGALVWAPDGSIVLSDAPIVLAPVLLPSSPLFLEAGAAVQ